MRPAHRLISSGSPFERTYGYSRAVVTGDKIHVSGTTGYDYALMTMPDDPAEQARNIYATFAEVLREAGAGFRSCGCAPMSPTRRSASRS